MKVCKIIEIISIFLIFFERRGENIRSTKRIIVDYFGDIRKKNIYRAFCVESNTRVFNLKKLLPSRWRKNYNFSSIIEEG